MSDTDMLYMASLEKRKAELEARIAELEDKHWNECRQIAHYDNECKEKHGTWSVVEQGYDAYIKCSECSLELSMSNYIADEWRDTMIYCPRCGVKMNDERTV